MGRKFQLRIDHFGLRYLFEHPTLNSKKARWLDFLCEFDFKIKNIKGKENKVVDALKRNMHIMHVESISVFILDLRKIIIGSLAKHEHYQHVGYGLQQSNTKKKYEGYHLEEGLLTYNDKLQVPSANHLRSAIMEEIHAMPYFGYPGY